jgi:hypothetical protein
LSTSTSYSGVSASHASADRRRDDRALRRHHASDRRADAEVHVGHHRDVAEHDRQLRHVLELLARRILHGDPARPRLDGDSIGLDQIVA